MRLFFLLPLAYLACSSPSHPPVTDAPAPPMPMRDGGDAAAPVDASADTWTPTDAASEAEAGFQDASEEAAADVASEAALGGDADADAGETESQWFVRESTVLCLGCPDPTTACPAAWDTYLTAAAASNSGPRSCSDADANTCLAYEIGMTVPTCTPGPAMNVNTSCSACNVGK